MKIIYFDIAALGILGIMVFSMIYRRNYITRSALTFFTVTATIFLTAAFDIAAVALDNAGAGHVIGKWIAHCGYLSLHSLTTLLYYGYFVSLTDTRHHYLSHPLRLIILFAPMIAYAVMVLLSPAMGLVFYLDGSDGYTRGPLFLLGYVVGGYYLIAGIVMLLRNRRLFMQREIYFLFIIYPLLLASMLIQYFYPKLIVELFANTLGLLLVWANIQRPEKLIDATTGFGNLTTYSEACRRIFMNGKTVHNIRVEIRGFRSLREVIGGSARDELLDRIGGILRRANRKVGARADIFHLEDGLFYLQTDSRHFDKSDALMKALCEELRFPYDFHGIPLDIRCYVCLFRIPEDISESEHIYNLGNLFDENSLLPTNTPLYAENLLREDRNRVLLDINRITERALNDNRFEMYYQPIYSREAGRFVMAEALLRLKDPEHGFINPELLIVTAEKNGIIGQLSDIILEKVCAFAGDGALQQLGLDSIEINLSAKQCMQENLTEHILEVLHRNQLTPAQIHFEITETAMAEEPAAMAQTAGKLAAAGFGLLLDDFGSGYSNFSRLQEIPVEIIKLDRSLIIGEDTTEHNAMLKGLIDMIHSQGKQVLAEGVETEQKARLLYSFGCDLIQGYFYSRPLPPDALPRKLAQMD